MEMEIAMPKIHFSFWSFFTNCKILSFLIFYKLYHNAKYKIDNVCFHIEERDIKKDSFGDNDLQK